MTIAILGGTGPEGLGIAARLAAAGEAVVIGSRDAGRAADAARMLTGEIAGARLRGLRNPEAAAVADVVVIAVPAPGLAELLRESGPGLRDKIVLEVVNAIRVVDGVYFGPARAADCAAARIAASAPGVRIVSGLKHVSAANLRAVERRLEGDVLLCGDDDDAKTVVAGLVRRMPDLRPIDAGSLAIAPLLDQVTALLLNVNRRHHAETSLRIVGL
jgi:NADPH-dependent F420 reductase